MSTNFQCVTCIHYRMFKRCEAFPDAIPDEIYSGEVLHDQPYRGDNGIQYEPMPENIDASTDRVA